MRYRVECSGMRLLLGWCAALLMSAGSPVWAQWSLLTSNTQASLRGIVSLDGGKVAWASGTRGTVVRTTDGGQSWRTCAVPEGAQSLDFRGVQALDQNVAVVMSSGPGQQSRVYKTTDGCATWKLVFTNPDAPDGFFDALRVSDSSSMELIGDPVRGVFPRFRGTQFGDRWEREPTAAVPAETGESLFAASNSVLVPIGDGWLFVTGGPVSRSHLSGGATTMAEIPLPHGESAGAFAVATGRSANVLVAVGGDYKKPDQATGTCAVSRDGGRHWTAADTPPHGYRSAVAYDPSANRWIAVGPNGTDVSTDDGRHWSAWRPGSGEAADADQQWNAISLPYVVGPKGRIGKLAHR